MIKKHKSEDNIEVKDSEGAREAQREEANNKIIVKIKDNVSPYIPATLEEEI